MLTILLLAAPAHAWEHTGWSWYQSQFPIPWSNTYPQDEDSLSEGEALDLLQDSWDEWQQAECAGVSNDFSGTASNDERDPSDGKVTIHFDDPGDEIEAGVLAVTYTIPGTDIVKETSSRLYRNVLDSDIVFNDNVDFANPEQIASGDCSNETSFVGVATHEIGHLHGLEHSCQQGDPCTETDKAEATMYWSVGSCDASQEDINADDIASITALYGASGSFSATSSRIGAVPLDVTFEIESDSDVTGANWNFGDGETGTGVNPTHTYTRAGQFTVQADIELNDEVCGSSIFTYDELGYVLVCDMPAPAEGSSGFFEMAHKDGLTWSTTNHTDVSVYGCVDFISWQVYAGSSVSGDPVDLDGDGDGDSIGAWSPLIQFPAEGTYTVVMNVGGPAGTQAGMLTVEVKDIAAEGGCSTSGADAGLGVIALAGLAGLRRRRS